MHPHTPAVPGMPTEPEPIAQVNQGMRVIDSAGQELGTVSDVHMPGDTAGTATDLPAAEAANLARTGYFRVETAGLLQRDAYGPSAWIAEVSEQGDGAVVLTVTRDRLTRAG